MASEQNKSPSDADITEPNSPMEQHDSPEVQSPNAAPNTSGRKGKRSSTLEDFGVKRKKGKTLKRLQEGTNVQANAIRTSTTFHATPVSIKETATPRITINGNAYDLEKVPEKFKRLMPNWQ